MLLSLYLAQVDSNLLPIGPQGTVEVRLNRITRTSDGKFVDAESVAESASNTGFVYVGESHDNADAHRWQARIIGALHEFGRDVIIGLEMYQRPKQGFLDMWTLGKLSESEFIERSDWKNQWGFDFGLYAPIFQYAQEKRLRMVALNIPRDWVRAVGRGGPAALPQEADVPQLYLGNKEHRQVFDALIGGHPMSAPEAMDNMYAAQVLWDESMADSAIKYLERAPKSKRNVFVVLAGNGHVMYKQGINYRVERRTGDKGLTIATAEIGQEDAKTRVSRGMADYVIGIRAPKREQR